MLECIFFSFVIGANRNWELKINLLPFLFSIKIYPTFASENTRKREKESHI